MPYKDKEKQKANAKKRYLKMKSDPVKYKEYLLKSGERRRAWQKRNPHKHAQYVLAAYYRDPDRKAKAKVKSQLVRLNLRKKLILTYGNQCKCCGEQNFGFLTIDHINGGGNQDFKSATVERVYRRMIEENDHTKYQVLCYNCNMGKHHFGKGTCPHKILFRENDMNEWIYNI